MSIRNQYVRCSKHKLIEIEIEVEDFITDFSKRNPLHNDSSGKKNVLYQNHKILSMIN